MKIALTILVVCSILAGIVMSLTAPSFVHKTENPKQPFCLKGRKF